MDRQEVDMPPFLSENAKLVVTEFSYNLFRSATGQTIISYEFFYKYHITKFPNTKDNSNPAKALLKAIEMAALSLKGQVGIVTGAGSPSGIGRSLVVALAKAGAKAVYACDLNMGNIPSLQKKIADMGLSCQVEGRLLDVSSEEETLALIKDILRMHGRFDFYFANAGFASVK